MPARRSTSSRATGIRPRAVEARLKALEKQIAEHEESLRLLRQVILILDERTKSPPPRQISSAQIAADQAAALAGLRTDRRREERRAAALKGLGGRAKAEQEARAQIEAMAQRVDAPPRRDDVVEMLQAKVAGLSRKAALRAWDDTAPAEWRKGGPKLSRNRRA